MQFGDTADYKSALLRGRLAAPGAAPLPILRHGAQSGLDGIMHDVTTTPRMFLVTTDPVVEGFRLPERLARPSENLVRLAGRESLPALRDAAQRMTRHRPEHDVNVIGHHDPRIQPVALAVEEDQGAGYKVTDLRSLQPARAGVPVQTSFNLAEVFPLDFLQRIRVWRRGMEFLRGLLLRLESLERSGARGLAFQQHDLRERIGEAKSDKVATPFALDVRQISARVDSGTKRVGRLRLYARRAQFKPHASNSRVWVCRKHGCRLARNLFDLQQRRGPLGRSAELHSAVSQIFNLQGVGKTELSRAVERSAECNSAIRQITNLRYGASQILRLAPIRPRIVELSGLVPSSALKLRTSALSANRPIP